MLASITNTQGIIAIAAAAVAVAALLGCLGLSVSLRRLRRAQRLVLGEREERDVIDSTEAGTKYNVEVSVVGVPQGAAATVEAYVEPVPGETDVENNKATYLAIFGE